jgi:hypothetical protein
MVGDAEVDAVKSFTKAWVGWKCLEGRKKPWRGRRMGKDQRAFHMIRNKPRDPAHSYLILVHYFTKLLTVE